MPALRSSMKIATCKASCGLSEANIRLMHTPTIGAGSDSTLPRTENCRCGCVNLALLVLFWNKTAGTRFPKTSPLSDLLLFLLRFLLFFLGASRLDPRNRSLQPVLHVLAKLFFRLRCGDRISVLIQGDVMARNIFVAELLGNEVIQQALMASVRTRRIPVVGTRQRVLEDRSGPPRRAIPTSIATLFNEIQFIAQNLKCISLIFRHNCLPG